MSGLSFRRRGCTAILKVAASLAALGSAGGQVSHGEARHLHGLSERTTQLHPLDVEALTDVDHRACLSDRGISLTTKSGTGKGTRTCASTLVFPAWPGEDYLEVHNTTCFRIGDYVSIGGVGKHRINDLGSIILSRALRRHHPKNTEVIVVPKHDKARCKHSKLAKPMEIAAKRQLKESMVKYASLKYLGKNENASWRSMRKRYQAATEAGMENKIMRKEHTILHRTRRYKTMKTMKRATRRYKTMKTMKRATRRYKTMKTMKTTMKTTKKKNTKKKKKEKKNFEVAAIDYSEDYGHSD